MKRRVLIVLAAGLLLLMPLAACGGESDGGSAASDEASSASGSGSAASGLSDTIVLPAGWEMLDAVSVADVEGVLGASGYEPWAETLNDAAGGKPQGGYSTADGAPSKINFLVYTSNGQAEYDRVSGFVENPTAVDGDWDQGIVGDMYDGADKMRAILVRRGDVTMRIAWSPEYYASWDQTELGTKLATMLVGKLYGS